MMRYISTTAQSAPASLDYAVNHCVAQDGGMFMPEELPVLPRAFFNNIGDMNLREIAFVVAETFFGQDIDSATLKAITDETFAFDAPMRRLGRDTFVLELFHGPTLTFKDYGARFMARLMHALDARHRRRRHVLVATSGNTGAAAANGLFKLEGTSVSVLYPKGRLTGIQRAQITALGNNIHPIEVAGTVEDCKMLVQKAIADPTLESLNLTGANSINIARLIPQITFALAAYAHMRALETEGADRAVYSIPSGNLSNVVATAMAKRMGLPCGKILAATGANNQVAPLLRGDEPAKRQPVATLAPSIDMSIPSGWPRLNSLYKGDLEAMRRDIEAPAPVDDATITRTVNGLRRDYGYTVDPHGAVAYAAARSIDAPEGTPRVVFATGHPAKQLDIMTRLTGTAIEMPVQLNNFMVVRRTPTIIPPTLPALKKHLHSIE